MTIIEEFLSEIKKYGIVQASRKSGVPIGTINGWVYEGRAPRLDNAQKVADAMNLEFLLFEKLGS